MANGGFVGISYVPFKGDLISEYLGSGTFTRSKSTGTVLVVGGGGQGGSSVGGGGGGGGVVLTPSSWPLPASTETITIGAGGSPSTPKPIQPPGDSDQGGNGIDSSFGTALIAKGGGGGGTYFNTGGHNGAPGGSGGGARRWPSNSGGPGIQPSQSGDSGTYGHGNPGQAGTGPDLGPPGTTGYGAGGGGAGAASSNITGGAAYNITAFPSSYGQGGYFAGGGGGGYQPGTSGNGGGGTATTAGGAGGANTQSEGLANTGGGGAGNDASTPQGQGGSGVVLVKELDVTQNVSGRWSMTDILEAVKAGNWTN